MDSHATVLPVTVETFVRRKSMNVHRIPVCLAARALINSIHISAFVEVDIQECDVKPTLMNARRIHAYPPSPSVVMTVPTHILVFANPVTQVIYVRRM